ncbi:DUF2254 domain-containing protein [Simplicispira psychrophila]|uniref:DUF2254 domain-containing protein n=1 Tax=Simplicispira psychrophila TaxID=80882 RepID=UPI00056A2FD4|nr:DUF2254 domain-containing protein [Simplicispira psychrophila]
MNAKLQKLIDQLTDAFWLVPTAMVLGGIALALGLLQVERAGLLPDRVLSEWLYNGGGTGARTLLGAIAASSIGVASTVFSITIAALSLAAAQMGPRLLRNFTRDRGVQLSLGAFLGTFSYALMVLRSVRTQEEGAFTPHLALSVGILLAFGCVAVLVYFVDHMANRINVDTVVELVSQDVHQALAALKTEQPQPPLPPARLWQHGAPVRDGRRGYLQHLDEDALADWAAAQGTVLRLLVRRGDYVFPGTPIAVLSVPVAGAEEAIRAATALGDTRGSAGDAEYAVRQLVEVAVRALSPGINDPHTAMSVLHRLGAALCDLAGSQLPHGVLLRQGQVALVVPKVSYASLSDLMFHMIRQNAQGTPAVLIRLLDVLIAVASCEPEEARRQVLLGHAERVCIDARHTVHNPLDLHDILERQRTLQAVLEHGVLAAIGAVDAAASASP